MSETAGCILRNAARLDAPGDIAAYVARERSRLEAVRDWALSEDFGVPGFGEAEVIDEGIAALDKAMAVLAPAADRFD